MKKLIAILVMAFSTAHAGVLQPTEPKIDPMRDYRICGEPARDKTGEIIRSAAVKAAYRKVHPCPSTGSYKAADACPGWAINHVIPLASGGCDSVINMVWMPAQIKSCASQYCIDRWERKYYGNPHGVITFTPDTK
jgi:hypothetical protein